MDKLLHLLAVTPINVSPLPQPTAGNAKITTIFAIVFTIMGALSLLMITVGGFRYVMSHGDPQAISRAKGTILYSLLGLIISISAVAIVTFVLGKV
jgi:hypothetical protein